MHNSLPMRSVHRLACTLAIALPLTLTLGIGCGSGDRGPPAQTAQPPVIVVQAPAEAKTATAYAGLAYDGQDTPAAKATANPDAGSVEPYDVVALLREFDPVLIDPPNDQLGEAAYDDLVSALAVADEGYLYGRIVSRVPMRGFYTREIRFWIEQPSETAEQPPEMATVELKVGSRGSPCEVAHVKSPAAQKVASQCFWLGNALDFRIPFGLLPLSIAHEKPLWVSGFQTCCQDKNRDKPFDEILQAQEVWRVKGLASEIDTGGMADATGGGAAPADKEATGAAKVPAP